MWLPEEREDVAMPVNHPARRLGIADKFVSINNLAQEEEGSGSLFFGLDDILAAPGPIDRSLERIVTEEYVMQPDPRPHYNPKHVDYNNQGGDVHTLGIVHRVVPDDAVFSIKTSGLAINADGVENLEERIVGDSSGTAHEIIFHKLDAVMNDDGQEKGGSRKETEIESEAEREATEIEDLLNFADVFEVKEDTDTKRLQNSTDSPKARAPEDKLENQEEKPPVSV